MREEFVQKGEEATPFNKSQTGEEFDLYLPTGGKRFPRSQKDHQRSFQML